MHRQGWRLKNEFGAGIVLARMLKTGVYWTWVSLALSVSAAPGLGGRTFTVSPEQLDFARCRAQPGNVPVPLGFLNPNIEIIDWTTAPTPQAQPGEFVLWFVQPLAGATLLTYDAGSVYYWVGSVWKPWPAPEAASRRLQVRPFPEAHPIQGIKIIVPAQPESVAGKPSYRARLPFVTLIPVRTRDMAKEAVVTAGYPGLSRPVTELTDGVVAPDRNFRFAPPSYLHTNGASPWVMLSWPALVGIRGLAIFKGETERGLDGCVVESYLGSKPVGEQPDDRLWQPVGMRISDPAPFRSAQYVVITHQLMTGALRLRCTNGPPWDISLGEVLVFTYGTGSE
jgi:hypothetical protein